MQEKAINMAFAMKVVVPIVEAIEKEYKPLDTNDVLANLIATIFGAERAEELYRNHESASAALSLDEKETMTMKVQCMEPSDVLSHFVPYPKEENVA